MISQQQLRRQLNVAGQSGLWVPSIDRLSNHFPSAATLPLSLKILLANLCVRLDGKIVTEEHLHDVANWDPAATARPEVPFTPARVVLQDFTGVPVVVDLAALRSKMQRLGLDPTKINPRVLVDLVIDHSVQVDHFGTAEALERNQALEYERNGERYALLRWAPDAFRGRLRIVRPGFGIVHQVNLERLACGAHVGENGIVDADTVYGTDSHTTMINGLGVFGWGVGGIEAEAAMLGQPTPLSLPDVVGLRLIGKLPRGVLPTDLVLHVTKLLRDIGVVEKFVEILGHGVAELPLSARAMLGNMAPEMGCTVVLSPTDGVTLDYLRKTNRNDEADLLHAFAQAHGIFGCPEEAGDTRYTQVVTLDLNEIVPAAAGPCAPHQHVTLARVPASFEEAFVSTNSQVGFSRKAETRSDTAEVEIGGEKYVLGHGAVVIAAITSCTNTSDPIVMMAAGLLAKNARRRGMKVPRFVKTSLAPGSQVVRKYLADAGLLPELEALGFNIVGFGCTSCIGNSGPLVPEVENSAAAKSLALAAVLSGNRNFPGRVNPNVAAAYLMSPPLVIAYALAGTTLIDLTKDPVGVDSAGQPVMLDEIWPSPEDIDAVVASALQPADFAVVYANAFGGDERWDAVDAPRGDLFEWDEASTYVQEPPYFEGELGYRSPSTIEGARALAFFGDGVTTDHISPAGSIAKNSPAANFLKWSGVEPADFNSYGARRGNHQVMMRGTFANPKLQNLLLERKGGYAKHIPSGEVLSIYDAAMRYKDEGTPLVIIAGGLYGSGSSRDWAAKGPALLGVKFVIATSFERIHRSNLIGMGILPLEFEPGQDAKTLGLTGDEVFSVDLSALEPRGRVTVHAGDNSFPAIVKINNGVELDYYWSGGVLPYVLERQAGDLAAV